MSDLVEFLLARIAEDEAPLAGHLQPGDEVDGTFYCACYEGDFGSPHLDEVAPNGARLFAECRAKRRIVQEAIDEELTAQAQDDMVGDLDGTVFAEATALRRVLMLLALPYADHPDYRDEWRVG